MNHDREQQPEPPLLNLARDFDTAAKTLRAVRLFGPANDANAWKGACETMARSLDQKSGVGG